MLKHVLGSKMGKANSLSRRLDWEIGVERDNEDEMLVKPEQLEVRKTEKVEIIVEGIDLLEKVRQSKVKDNEVVRAVEEIKQAGVKMLQDEKWREVDGVMYKEGKVYVPKNNKLRAEIIRLYHDMPVGGQRTVEDGRISYQKLLVGRSNQENEAIYGRMQFLPKKQELHRTASGQINA